MRPISRRGSAALAVALSCVLTSSCDVDDLATPAVEGPAEDAPLHPVEVHQPEALTSIATDLRDPQGRRVRIDCMTCHSQREEHDVPPTPEELGEIHGDMVYVHGAIPCLSCHDAERADRLHLADGTLLELGDVQRLCGQCHGVQVRDWDAGSHGGMRGYWDRRRGPRERNHCVDCHDPHQPRFPIFQPRPASRDRFLPVSAEHEGGHDE